MEIYRDLADRHELRADESTLVVDGPLVPVARPLMPRVSRQGRAAWKGHETGACYVISPPGTGPRMVALPDRAINGVTWGNWPCAWAPDDTLVIQTGKDGLFHLVHPDGTTSTVDMGSEGWSPTGIHHIEQDTDPSGRAIYRPILRGRTPSLNGVVFGIECWEISIDEFSPWMVALSNRGGPHGCVVKVHLTSGDAQMWVAPNDLQHPPRIAHGRVALSGTGLPDPDGLDWQPIGPVYVPPAPPVVTPPVPQPPTPPIPSNPPEPSTPPEEKPVPDTPPVKEPTWRTALLKGLVKVWPTVEPFLLAWLQARVTKAIAPPK